MTSVIELSGISKHFGSVVAVDHVDLAVRNGEFLTLLGPSGCGKSTLLRMIGGFEMPTTGNVRLMGQDVTYVPPQKRDVNMMFQDYALFPHMTVRQNIAYGLRMKGVAKSEAQVRAQEALELVGLPDKIDQYPQQLSGGQKQRIALARAIVRQPKVLLLDEPLSALDTKLREQMQVELKHMHDKIGITFIMVTHNQTEALVMSDRVVVMRNGRIAQEGTPQDLYEHPRDPYVANFIGTTNFIPAQLVSNAGGEAVMDVAGGRLTARDVTLGTTTGPVRIGIRPEKARILTSAESGFANALEGRVSEHIYHGTSLRTIITLADGSDIFVDAMLPMGIARAERAEIGQTVRLGVEPENVFVFAGGA